MPFDVYCLVARILLVISQYSDLLNNLAELDTIYRQIISDEDTESEIESTKINEYLTYNW